MSRMVPSTDWSAWHEEYDDPDSWLPDRLRVVRQHIGSWLDASAPRPVRVVSACAGDGRDLLGVLAARDDAGRVTATLVEADRRLAARAAEHARGLGRVEVRQTDAGTTGAYAGAVPADLVLLCGIFGNVVDDDVRRTVAATPQLCAPGAVVIWTRHRDEPDLTPRIRGWFAGHGFVEEAFVAPERELFSVGVHRLVADPQPLAADQRLFTFVR